ncbi:MAG: GntR family transcriptional regulator [Alicyclobacillus sp.]|nr:GntR family transcriptional regulator [Alicyclobacillus sp.]
MGADLALYRQVYNYVKELIISGRYKVGDMIPTEQELMEKFNVSRITTNRALQMLTAEGLVQRRAGVGTFVSGTPALESTKKDSVLIEHQSSAVNESAPFPRDSSLVGFVIPFLDGSFGPTIIHNVEMLLNERGVSVVLASTQGDQKKEAEVIERLVKCGVKGLIVLPVNGEYYSEAILRLHVQKFPIVLVDKSLPGLPIPSITSDNFGATKALTDHLISLGHQNIAFFSPVPSGTSTLIERYNGFLNSLQNHGLVMQPDYLLTSVLTGASSKKLDNMQVEVVEQFLVQHPEVTAVVAADDQLAEHLLVAARRVGREVPRDLSIACFDGRDSKGIYWDFTHAIQDEAEMARHCVRILDDLWADKHSIEPGPVVLPCRLHLGQSTGPIAAQRKQPAAEYS